MSQQTIRQKATIVKITKSDIELEVCRPEACAACKARSACTSESEDGKRISLTNDGVPREVGDEVYLSITNAVGLKATLIAYLTPVVIVLILVLVLEHFNVGEKSAGAITLGALVLYFLLLRLMRTKLNKEITIQIEK